MVGERKRLNPLIPVKGLSKKMRAKSKTFEDDC